MPKQPKNTMSDKQRGFIGYLKRYQDDAHHMLCLLSSHQPKSVSNKAPAAEQILRSQSCAFPEQLSDRGCPHCRTRFVFTEPPEFAELTIKQRQLEVVTCPASVTDKLMEKLAEAEQCLKDYVEVPELMKEVYKRISSLRSQIKRAEQTWQDKRMTELAEVTEKLEQIDAQRQAHTQKHWAVRRTRTAEFGNKNAYLCLECACKRLREGTDGDSVWNYSKVAFHVRCFDNLEISQLDKKVS